MNQTVDYCSGYGDPQFLGSNAISAPNDCNGQSTYIGNQYWNDGQPFDSRRCVSIYFASLASIGTVLTCFGIGCCLQCPNACQPYHTLPFLQHLCDLEKRSIIRPVLCHVQASLGKSVQFKLKGEESPDVLHLGLDLRHTELADVQWRDVFHLLQLRLCQHRQQWTAMCGQPLHNLQRPRIVLHLPTMQPVQELLLR